MGFFIFLAAAVILVLAFSFYTYRICFHAPKRRTDDLNHLPTGEQYVPYAERMIRISKIMEAASCEWVCTTASDGHHLWGRYYEYYPGAPIFLLFHGYRSTALRDCAGGFALGQKLGFNVLAVDQRSHGRSDGRVISFGVRERQDCVNWIEYINQRFPDQPPIVLSGISMGAATVLMAADLKLPNNVVGIMADCPYSSPTGIITKVAADMGYPKKLAYPFIWLAAFLFAGFRVDRTSAEESVKKGTIPILLVHGEDDRFVPCQMSRDIHANCNVNVQLHTFPEAGHGLCYLSDPRRYEKICVDFLWSLESLQPYLESSEFAKKLRA